MPDVSDLVSQIQEQHLSMVCEFCGTKLYRSSVFDRFGGCCLERKIQDSGYFERLLVSLYSSHRQSIANRESISRDQSPSNVYNYRGRKDPRAHLRMYGLEWFD